jgi:protein-S-isoprenylcysteine O-methyltransferase Ste14
MSGEAQFVATGIRDVLKKPSFAIKLFGGVIYNQVLFALLLFLPAGTLYWWRAWVFMGVLFALVAMTMLGVFPGNEELLNERYGSPIQKGQPLADKIILLSFVASFVGSIVFIPLDVFRFQLLAKPGTVVACLGLALVVAGWCIIAWSLSENAFAAPVVKYQQERHQKVIDSGPYSFVRHPMYAGFIPFGIGIALWLQSYAGALLVVVPILLIATRILVEERFLTVQLKGYERYTERVRYRMIPFIW